MSVPPHVTLVSTSPLFAKVQTRPTGLVPVVVWERLTVVAVVSCWAPFEESKAIAANESDGMRKSGRMKAKRSFFIGDTLIPYRVSPRSKRGGRAQLCRTSRTPKRCGGRLASPPRSASRTVVGETLPLLFCRPHIEIARSRRPYHG